MKQILFTKFCSERKKEFQIATKIWKIDSKKYVTKESLHNEGNSHVMGMEKSYQLLINDYYLEEDVYVCPCKKVGEELQFKYIDGKNLNVIMGECVSKKDYLSLYQWIEKLCQIVKNVSNSQKFEKTSEFINIFGDLELSEELESSKISNIDMIAGNLIIGEKINIVDYEWVFQFPIPFKFIIFRTLFLSHDIARLPEEIQEKTYEIAEISYNEKEIFLKMEINFQSYVSENNQVLSKIYETLKVHNYMLEAINTTNIGYQFKAYTNKKGNEERIVDKTCSEYQTKQKIELTKHKNAETITIKPIGRSCIFHLDSLYAIVNDKKVEVEIIESNEDLIIFKDYYFLAPPEIIIKNEAYDQLIVSYKIYTDIDAIIGNAASALKENNELKNERAILKDRILCLDQDVKTLNQTIQNMENTKIWKLYKKLKRS